MHIWVVPPSSPLSPATLHKDTRGFKGCVEGAFSESGFFSEPIFAFLLFLHFSHAFLPPPNHSSPFFLRTCPARPNPHTRAHTCPGITPATVDWCQSVRLAGRKRHARFERALRLWQSCRQWRPQPWSCMDAAPRVSLARCSRAALLSQHIDGRAWPGRVAQAPRAGRARAPWSC
jgi:hypothetical protein